MFYKKMLSRLFASACILFLAGCSMPTPGSPSTPGSGSSGPCANPLYPVKVGVTWNYQMSGTTTGTFSRTIQSVDSGGFTDQDVFSSGAIRSGKWNCAAGDLTALDPVGDTTANVQLNGNSTNFQTTALTGVTLPAHVQAGDSWNQTLSLHGTLTLNGATADATSDVTLACTGNAAESVTVPAGTFDATKVACQDTLVITVITSGVTIPTTLNFTMNSWYAPGIGMVKSIGSGSGFDTTIELTSYTIP